MTKNIVYFGEQSLFSETVKNMAQIEEANFFDFSSWDECEGQFSSLDPSFIFIDLDTFDPTSLTEDVQSFQCVFFKSQKDEDISWSSKCYFMEKPLEILQFRNLLQDLLNG